MVFKNILVMKNNIQKKSHLESQDIKHINVELFWFDDHFHLCFVLSLKTERKPPKYTYPCLLLKQIKKPFHYTVDHMASWREKCNVIQISTFIWVGDMKSSFSTSKKGKHV